MFFVCYYSAVASVGALIDYLWLNKDPNDPSYPFRRRATLCYITHIIVLILKRSQPVNTPEEPCTHSQAATDPQHHPTYSHIMPFLFKFTLPLIRSVIMVKQGYVYKSIVERLCHLHFYLQLTLWTVVRYCETTSFKLLSKHFGFVSSWEGCCYG